MIEARDFQVLAETWIQGSGEAGWRSAVSRAYYAAFHQSRRLLSDLGFQVPRADRAHAYLWMRLSNCGNLTLQMAGSDLNTLRGDRNRADYDVEKTLAHDDALVPVQTARRILQILGSAVGEPMRTQITDTMRVYERDVLKDVTWQP